MFGHRIGSLALTWVTILATIVAGNAVWNGYNVVDGSFDLGRGFSGTASMFGGIWSFWALATVIVLLILAGLGVWLMQGYDYTGQEGRRTLHLVLALGALVAAALIGTAWIKLPDGAGWVAVSVLVFVTLVTVLVAWLLRPRTT